VVAGLLWHGAPRRLIDSVIDDESVTLYSSPALIDELANTLSYAKFARRIAQSDASIAVLVAQYEALVTLVSPTHTPRVVPNDPDDDHVLAAAVSANAQWIVSGDKHLLDIKSYQNISVVTAAEAVTMLVASN